MTLWYVGFLGLVIVIFGVVAYQIVLRELDHDINRRLEEMSRIFIADTIAEAEEESEVDHDRVVSTSISEFQLRDYHFAVWSESRPFNSATNEIEGRSITPTGKRFTETRIGNENFRVSETSFALGSDKYKLLALHPLSEEAELQTRLLSLFLVSAIIALVLAGIGGYLLVRRSIRPVVEMSREAGQISAENLGQRLSINNHRDEVGQLGQVINDLLTRLDASFEQQRRFMADASHELRTPLAIVRGEAEVALSKDDRTAPEYRESLNILHDESKRLTKIVEDLFTLARADAGQFRPTFSQVYLDEIVGEAARSMRVLADRKNIELGFVSDAEMPFNGDESLLRRMFLNLLDNAIKYSRPQGHISVVCVATSTDLQISVTDNGIGISADERDMIFDRFYRVDKARQRADETASSGAGLGLSIARWIAEIHHGKIDLLVSGDDGSTFSVTFPR